MSLQPPPDPSIVDAAHAPGSEAPIPRRIHFTVPARLSEVQTRAIDRARALHPGWEVTVWQDPISPEGFELAPLWKRANSGAQLADLVRLEVVYRFGGIYLDSDLVVEKSLEPLRTFGFFLASENGRVLTNAAFGGAAGHPALRRLIDAILQDEHFDWSLAPVFTTGPLFFTRELKWFPDVTVLPRATFYPYGWTESASPSHAHTYGVHLWDHSWKGVDKDGYPAPPRPTLIQRLTRPILDRTRAAHRAFMDTERGVTLLSPKTRTYTAGGTLCVDTVHGFKILLDGDDVSITPEIATCGYYELREELFLRKVVKGGDWAIDVGANVGMFTLLLARLVGAWGRVFAYEPNPTCRVLLQRSLTMNWMHDRVDVRASAVAAAAGRATLTTNPHCLGGATLAAADARGAFESTARFLEGNQAFEVPVVRLDEEFPVDLPIRILKIDAEGFEHEVLAGAERLVERGCIDFIMMEAVQEVAGPSWTLHLAAMMRIEALGYRAHTIGDDLGLRPFPLQNPLPPMPGRNLVFVSPHAR